MMSILKHTGAGILIAILAACSGGNNKAPIDRLENEAGLLNEFIIMAYSGPPLEEVTLERYQEIEEAGIEYLVPGNGTFNEEQNLRAMDLAEKSGFKIVPIDMRVLPFALKPDIDVDTVVIRQVVDSYKEHPAFAGYVVRDEPNASLFPALANITQAFLNLDSIHEPLINLFPSYGSPIQLGFEDYRSYIRSYIEIVGPRLLAYDNYALREGGTWYEIWYKDLKIVREESRKARIPFMVFLQSQGIAEGLRVPNRAGILWQVNTALAYGSHGVGWFSYWTPMPDQGMKQEEGAAPPLIESHYNAMIDLDGNRTEVYDHVREANLYLKKAGRGLMDWDNQDVARYEAGTLVEGSSPMVTPSGDQANVVIGTFAKDQAIRLVLSNASCEERASFSLSLSPGWKTDQLFTSIAAKPAGNVKSLMEWDLEPGGSVIIDLVKTTITHSSTVEDRFTPLPANSIRFTGHFAEAIEHSMEHWNMGVVPYDSLVDLFRNGRKFFAQGEMWGKAVRSGSMFYRYSKDPELKIILHSTVKDMLSTIRENGSISCSEIPDQPDSQGGDLWERKYVLLGLHGYYTHVEQDSAVLEAMVSQANCIIEQIGPYPKTRIVDQGWSPNHIESSTLLEPIMRLYWLTGESSYLDFARYIVEEEGGALGHNVIEDAFNNVDPMEIGGVYPKAYEMMSLFEGLVEYYRATGNEKWKQAIMNLYHKIIEKEITIIGNAGGDIHHPAVMGEGWGNTALEQTNPDMNRMMETCVGVTWLKLCSQILRLRGDPSAMDMIEKYAYNGLIGAMKPGGDGFSYVNRLNGSKTITTGWGGIINDVHVTCCNLNGPMGLAYLPFVAVMNSNEGPVVNLYNACKANLTSPKGRSVKLTIDTDFPLNGEVSLQLESTVKERYTLRLRIPEWSTSTLLKVNDQPMEVTPGTYAEITRKWSGNDRINLDLDMRCRLLDAPYGSNREGDYFKALVRGPVVLSRDENLDPGYSQAVLIISNDGYVEITPENPELPGTRMQFKVPTTEGNISMVDYASVNNWNGTHIYTWLPIPK